MTPRESKLIKEVEDLRQQKDQLERDNKELDKLLRELMTKDAPSEKTSVFEKIKKFLHIV